MHRTTPAWAAAIVAIAALSVTTACQVETWGPWSPCSAECGAGIRTRSRSVLVPSTHPGDLCPPLFETIPCVGQSACLGADLPPFDIIERKLRPCEARLPDTLAAEAPVRYEFEYQGGLVTGFTCFTTPCPAADQMLFNTQPCFNQTSPWSFDVADRATFSGTFDSVREVLLTERAAPCSPSQRITFCGDDSKVGCMANVTELGETESSLSQCMDPPDGGDGGPWRACPPAWQVQHACLADERACVWSPAPNNTGVGGLTGTVLDHMRFDCPWGEWQRSNVAPEEWSLDNWIPCTEEDSVRECGAEWARRYTRREPCRKRYLRYSQLAGHEYHFDTSPCLREPCDGIEQLSQCGGFSHYCSKACPRVGDCFVDVPASTCQITADRSARACTAAETAGTCAGDGVDPIGRCRVLCDDNGLATGCVKELRCAGTDWEPQYPWFERVFRSCNEDEIERHSCSPSIDDCVVQCDDMELTSNCDMEFRCAWDSTAFRSSVRMRVHAVADDDASAAVCGPAWESDPERGRCTFDSCQVRGGGAETVECECDAATCSCPFSFPSSAVTDELGYFEPCASASAIFACPTRSSIAQQTCGVRARSCVTNCTGLALAPTCTAPETSGAACVCDGGTDTAPLFGLPCNGHARPCNSEEFDSCGPAASGCVRVTEVYDAELGASVSLSDPDRGVDSSYVLCGCHTAAAAGAQPVTTPTGDLTWFCDGGLSVSPGFVEACNETEAETACGAFATGCTRVAADASLCPRVVVDGHTTCFAGGIDAGSAGWEVLAGSCECNATESLSITRPNADRLNGVFCPGPAFSRECTIAEEAALRWPCTGPCRYDCVLGGGCSWDVRTCYGAAEAVVRRDCNSTEIVAMCGSTATVCQADFVWGGDNVTTSDPPVPDFTTRFCDRGHDDTRPCTIHETVDLCPGNSAVDRAAWFRNPEAVHHILDYRSTARCERESTRYAAVPGTCPSARPTLRSCNRTEAYMFCSHGSPAFRDPVALHPDAGEGCLMACATRDTDLAQQLADADAARPKSDCHHVGLCTTPNQTVNVTNPEVLAEVLGSVFHYVSSCVVRVAPDPDTGVSFIPISPEEFEGSCVVTESYELHRQIQAMQNDDSGNPDDDEDDFDGLSAPGHVSRMHSQSHSQPTRAIAHHHNIMASRHASLSHRWHPAHSMPSWHVHAPAWNVRYAGQHKRRARHASAMQSHSRMMAQTNSVVNVSVLVNSTAAAHTRSCGAPGSTLHVDVWVASDGTALPDTNTCACNHTGGWYFHEPGAANGPCVQGHERACTYTDLHTNLPQDAACDRQKCTVLCRRVRLRTGITFGAEHCYMYGDGIDCLGGGEFLPNQTLSKDNVAALCGARYGAYGWGTCRYDNTYPVPVQTCRNDSSVVCVCNDPGIKFTDPLTGHRCGRSYVTRECDGARAVAAFCGPHGTSCIARCHSSRIGSPCYEADSCQCAVAPPAELGLQLWMPAGRLARYKHCGYAQVTNQGATPTCDVRNGCGPLTAWATYSCPHDRPLDACSPINTTCGCLAGATSFHTTQCGGYLRKCEPREVAVCRRVTNNTVCFEDPATSVVSTGCLTSCSPLTGQCGQWPSDYHPAATDASAPLLAQRILRTRLVNVEFDDATQALNLKRVFVAPNDPVLLLTESSIDELAFVACSEAQYARFCAPGTAAGACRLDRKTGRFVRGSCVCPAQQQPARVKIAADQPLPDSGHECATPGSDTWTRPCDAQTITSLCGVHGVAECVVKSVIDYDASGVVSNITTGVTTCGCFKSYSDMRRASIVYRNPTSNSTVVCWPDYDSLGRDGTLPSDKAIRENVYTQRQPWVDLQIYGSCPFSERNGLVCSGVGVCQPSGHVRDTLPSSAQGAERLQYEHDECHIRYKMSVAPLVFTLANIGTTKRGVRSVLDKYGVWLDKLSDFRPNYTGIVWGRTVHSSIERLANGTLTNYSTVAQYNIDHNTSDPATVEWLANTAGTDWFDRLVTSRVRAEIAFIRARHSTMINPGAHRYARVHIFGNHLDSIVAIPTLRTATKGAMVRNGWCAFDGAPRASWRVSARDNSRPFVDKPFIDLKFGYPDLYTMHWDSMAVSLGSSEVRRRYAFDAYGTSLRIPTSVQDQFYVNPEGHLFNIPYRILTGIQARAFVGELASGSASSFIEAGPIPYGALAKRNGKYPWHTDWDKYDSLEDWDGGVSLFRWPHVVAKSTQSDEEIFQIIRVLRGLSGRRPFPYYKHEQNITAETRSNALLDAVWMSLDNRAKFTTAQLGQYHYGSSGRAPLIQRDQYYTLAYPVGPVEVTMPYLRTSSSSNATSSPNIEWYTNQYTYSLFVSPKRYFMYLGACLLGPGLPPPKNNVFCTKYFRDDTYIKSDGVSVISTGPAGVNVTYYVPGGATYKGAEWRATIGNVPSRATDFQCFVARQVNPIGMLFAGNDAVPCSSPVNGSKCVCQVGYTGSDCGTFGPDKQRTNSSAESWIYPIYNAPGMCRNGTWSLVGVETTRLRTRWETFNTSNFQWRIVSSGDNVTETTVVHLTSGALVQNRSTWHTNYTTSGVLTTVWTYTINVTVQVREQCTCFAGYSVAKTPTRIPLHASTSQDLVIDVCTRQTECQDPSAATCGNSTVFGVYQHCTAFEHVPVCSGHGACAAGNGCACEPGFYGKYCQHSWSDQCPKNATTGQMCNNRGLCVPTASAMRGTHGPAICLCHTGSHGGFSGSLCETPYLKEPSKCNYTNGGVLHVDSDTLDVVCLCTNKRYTGPYCTIDRCPRTGWGQGPVCGNQPGFGCVHDTASNRFVCRALPGTSAANASSVDSVRYKGCAVETDVLEDCIYTEGGITKMCGDSLARGSAKCRPFTNSTSGAVIYKCVCGPTETGDKCQRNMLMGPGDVTTVECSGNGASVDSGTRCRCPGVVTNTTGPTTLWTGQFCQYNVTDACGYTPIDRPGERHLCAGHGSCQCSGTLNGTHCLNGAWGCNTCDDGYGGAKCEGTCAEGSVSCQSINICPTTCGTHGRCELVAGVYKCVCDPEVKYGYSETTGACTRDLCSNVWNASLGWPLYGYNVDARANDSDPTQCVCNDPRLVYETGRCALPACNMSSSGWLCGDPLPGWELPDGTIDRECYLASGYNHTTGANIAKLKACNELGGGTQRVCRRDGTGCQCGFGYTKNATTGMCAALCVPDNTLSTTTSISPLGLPLLGCVCKPDWSGARCDQGPCPVSVGRATMSGGQCVCKAPFVGLGPGCGTDCGPGSFNTSTGACDCPGVYTGDRCEAHRCGTHGWPNPANASDCTCSPQYAGTYCAVRICPAGSTFTGVSGGAAVCACDNPSMVLNATAVPKFCYEPAQPSPTSQTPVTNMPGDDNATAGGAPVPALDCRDVAFNSALFSCACSAGGGCTLQPLPALPPASNGSHSTACANGGVQTRVSGVCNCTGTQFAGNLCNAPICSNGCNAVWSSVVDDSNATVSIARCQTPGTPNFQWSNNWTNPVWDCTVSRCGPGGTPGADGSCVCSRGYILRATPIFCVRPCHTPGLAFYHPQTGACVCKRGFDRSQCQDRVVEALAVQPRMFRTHMVDAGRLVEITYHDTATTSRFAADAAILQAPDESLAADFVPAEYVSAVANAAQISAVAVAEHIFVDVPQPPAVDSTPRARTALTSASVVAISALLALAIGAATVAPILSSRGACGRRDYHQLQHDHADG